MGLDSANRSFYTLIGIAATPFLLAGSLGCGMVAVTAYRVTTNGSSVLDGSAAGFAAAAFVLASAAGAALAVRSLLVQHIATRRLMSQLRRREIAPTRRLNHAADQASIGRIQLVDDGDCYSLTYGAVRTVTAISTGLVERLDDQQLTAVLVHERYHVTNRDPLKTAIARAISAAYFFLPATSQLLDRYLTRRELAADVSAVRRCGRRALAGALAAASGGPATPPVGAAAAFGGNTLLEVRISQLETDAEPAMSPVPAHSMTATVLGLVALFLGLLATAAAVDTPTIFDSRMTGGADILGALACAAAWVLGVFAVRNRRRHPSAIRTGQPASPTTRT